MQTVLHGAQGYFKLTERKKHQTFGRKQIKKDNRNADNKRRKNTDSALFEKVQRNKKRNIRPQIRKGTLK